MRKITFLMLFVLSVILANAATRYIKVAATGTGDGTSWVNADGNANIQTQIDAVLAAGGGEVQFAAGTYLIPATIIIRDGVNLTGGFATDDSGARDLWNNQTILDGQFARKILQASEKTLANGGANTFTKITTVDGFIIQKGSSSYGSAAFLTYGCVLQNCIIRNNNGSTYGAAIMVKRTLNLSSPTSGWNMGAAFINCMIINNTSSSYAAGIWIDQDAHLSMINCVIANNKSTDATNGIGGLYIGGNIRYSRITNNIFYNNSSAAVATKNNFYSPTTNFAAVYANYFSDATIPVGLQTATPSNKTATDIASPNFANPSSFQGFSATDLQMTEIANSDWRLKSTSALIGLGATPTTLGNMPYPFITMTSFGSPTDGKLYSSVTTDIMGSNRIINTTTEMGAYEYNPIVVSTATANVSQGTVSANVTVSKGSTATVTATPVSGFKFTKWNDGTSDVSTSASYSFVPTADVTLTATFDTDFETGIDAINSGRFVVVNNKKLTFTENGQILIYNTTGKLVVDKTINGETINITESGIYFVKLRAEQVVKTQKVLIY